MGVCILWEKLNILCDNNLSNQMKSNERVIKKGNYYQLQTIQDLMMQQKIPKKQQIQTTQATQPINENIITELPSRANALKNYTVSASTISRTEDQNLDHYQFSLQQLLRLPIRDEERLEIQKILKQIAAVKNSEEIPLNSLPKATEVKQGGEAPKQINLVSSFNTEKLEQDVQKLENIKYIELSKLENLVEILLGDTKEEQPQQPNNQIDPKTKQEIESLYNNLSQLKCLNNLSGIINKLQANEIKYIEMKETVEKTDEINRLNKQVLTQFENDELVLKQLEETFKKNIEAVREIVKKLSQ